MSAVPQALDPRMAAEHLSVYAQPVFERYAGGFRPHFLEFLTRGPAGTNFEPAGVLFEYARRKNQECALDRACIERAMGEVHLLPPDLLLSLNVHASTLEGDPDFPRFIAETNRVEASRIVLEICEHAPAGASHAFRRALDSLRALGFRFAMDDIGVGQASYRMVLDCAPEYLKVDQYIVQGCASDGRRRAVLESLVTLGARLGARVVAEGVETLADLHAVEALGIDLVQGYFFGKPRPVGEVASELP